MGHRWAPGYIHSFQNPNWDHGRICLSVSGSFYLVSFSPRSPTLLAVTGFLFFHFYYLNLSVCVCVCARVNMCGGQRSVLDVFLYCPPPYLLRKSLRLKLVLADCRDWLVSKLGGRACLHPWPGAKVTAMHNLALSMGAGYPHSGPPACVAGILPTERSPQPPSF